MNISHKIQELISTERQAHNLKVAGSNPAPATSVSLGLVRFLAFLRLFQKAQNPQCFLQSFKTCPHKIPAVLLLLLITACSNPTTISPELYATSYHTRETSPNGTKYNQRNPGAGIHITQGKEIRYGARFGTFKNSFKKQSTLAAGTIEYCAGDTISVCGGVMAGAITGYGKRPQFAAAPTVELGYDRFAINFTAYPSSDRKAAVLTGWIKFKIMEF